MKYKITIKGEAKTDYSNLQELDGIDCQDRFSEYFDRDWEGHPAPSYTKVVTGGYMHFECIDDKLYAVTKYSSSRELTETELNELGSYTQGQWSDGIGEGFEQNPCYTGDDDEEVYISPWFHGQKLEIKQEFSLS